MSRLVDSSISIYEALENIKKMVNMLCLHFKDSMYGVWSK